MRSIRCLWIGDGRVYQGAKRAIIFGPAWPSKIDLSFLARYVYIVISRSVSAIGDLDSTSLPLYQGSKQSS